MTLLDAQDIWKKVLFQMKETLSPRIYKLHFEGSTVTSITGTTWYIGVRSQYSVDEITKKFQPILQPFLLEFLDQPFSLEFVVVGNHRNTRKQKQNTYTTPSLFSEQHEAIYAENTLLVDDDRMKNSISTDFSPVVSTSLQSSFNGLNPNFVFSNFIVGSSNNVAYAAAQAVAQNPGKGYNPLFIYGGVGVGKTHLMQAVGNALVAQYPVKKVLYFPAERFINEFIQSLQTKSTDKFRYRYRSCDVILVDDIQFISGKDTTQEEFFHTFNEIVGRGGHVLMTSDRTPEEIPQLEVRLSSRFKGGMMVDIGLPDYEMRVAIIQTKCKDMGEYLNDESIAFLASRIQTNTRELQGKLFQILSKLKTSGLSGTLEYVRQAFGEESTQSVKLHPTVNPQKVIQVIHHHFAIKRSDLLGSRRTKNLVIPRQIAMYLLKNEIGLPLEKVGELLGGRDHTTVLHGVRQIETLLSTDEHIQKEIMLIKQELSTYTGAN